MPRPKSATPPPHRLYKRTNSAVVTLGDKDFYLGEYGSESSRQEYDRLVTERLANGLRRPSTASDYGAPKAGKMIAAYILLVEPDQEVLVPELAHPVVEVFGS